MAATSPALLTMDNHGSVDTTTISTIAVQSGNTRIVIALLQVCIFPGLRAFCYFPHSRGKYGLNVPYFVIESIVVNPKADLTIVLVSISIVQQVHWRRSVLRIAITMISWPLEGHKLFIIMIDYMKKNVITWKHLWLNMIIICLMILLLDI